MQDEPGLTDYRLVVKRHCRLVLFAPLLVGLISGAVTMFVMPRTYEAEATILIPQSSSPVSTLAALAGNLSIPLMGMAIGSPGGAIDTYKAILESHRIREGVADELRLRHLLRTKGYRDVLRMLRDVTRISADTKANMLRVKVTTKGTPRFSGSRKWGPRDQQARKLCADIANAYVDQLSRYLTDNVVFQAQRNRAFVEQQKAIAEAELRKAEATLLAYQTTHGIVSLPDEVKVLIEHHAELEGQRTAADLELTQASEQLQVLKSRLLAQVEAGITDSFPDAQAVVEQSRKQLAQLEVELAVKSESLAASNPEIRQLTRQIEETKAHLAEELRKAYSNVEGGLVTNLIELEVQKAAAEAKRAGLVKALSRTATRLSRLPTELVGIGRVQRELEVKQEIYKLLSAEYERAKIEEAKEVRRVDRLDRAIPPKRKSGPPTILIIAVTMLATFASLCAWMLLVDVDKPTRQPAISHRPLDMGA